MRNKHFWIIALRMFMAIGGTLVFALLAWEYHKLRTMANGSTWLARVFASTSQFFTLFFLGMLLLTVSDLYLLYSGGGTIRTAATFFRLMLFAGGGVVLWSFRRR